MKITTYFSVAAMMAMLAANTSCTKEETIAPEENKNIITLNVSTETLSRISLTEEGASGSEEVKVAWEEGDVLEVWARPDAAASDGKMADLDMTKVSQFTISTGIGEKNATFSGTLSDGGSPQYLNVVYRKNTDKNQKIQENPKTLEFQCSAFPQKLATDLEDAPLLLAGVFEKQDNGNYKPLGGKIVYGGALFKVEIKGLPQNKEVDMIKYRCVEKWMGKAPVFKIDGDNVVCIGAGGIDSKWSIDTKTNIPYKEQVFTTADGSLTFYSFLPTHLNGSNDADYYVYIKYVGDTTEYPVGVIKFIGEEGNYKPIKYGKCYTVTLDASTASSAN